MPKIFQVFNEGSIKKAVFSFFPYQTSGKTFAWWDYFPSKITEYLEKTGIHHRIYYRNYIDGTKGSNDGRFKATQSQIENPIWVWNNIRKDVKQYDRVIVHSHIAAKPLINGLLIFNSKFNNNTRWVMTDHDLWAPVNISQAKMRVRSFLRGCGFLPDIVLGCSQASRERLKHIYGKKNTDYIYNGIQLPEVTSYKEISNKPTKALFVGRLESYKGVWDVIKAFEKLQDNLATLTIVGDGAIYPKVMNYINNNKLNGRIQLLGNRKDIYRIMLEHEFAIIPTLYEENCPVVSLEAQSCYLPCIYTNSGGLPETQIQGKTGIMIEKNNPDAIINAIKYFQEDRSRFNQMRLDARTNSLNFSIDKMAKEYCDLYLKVFNGENI